MEALKIRSKNLRDRVNEMTDSCLLNLFESLLFEITMIKSRESLKLQTWKQLEELEERLEKICPRQH